jgi:hypothetical protein
MAATYQLAQFEEGKNNPADKSLQEDLTVLFIGTTFYPFKPRETHLYPRQLQF